MILPEYKIEQIISYLPETIDGFKPVYHFGDDIELNAFIKLYNHKVYPLIYQTSYQWDYDRKSGKASLNLEAFIAVQNKSSMLNSERWETSYKNVLMPTFENLVKAMEQSNIISSDYQFSMSNHPNYGSVDLNSKENKIIDVIDAIRFSVNITISNKNCIIKNMIF